MKKRLFFNISMTLFVLQGCATNEHSSLDMQQPAKLLNTTAVYSDLVSLPPPLGKIPVSVYNFRDLTGQYKQQPAVSSFSTAVTQGSTSILLQALKESNWFIPVEREGLNNLLTERKIIRAAIKNNPSDKRKDLPPLQFANIMIEGGITGYDTNIVSGGSGIKYFGVGGSRQYRSDQMTVHLRAIDVNSGRILNTISTSKTIYSKEVRKGLYQFVSYKRLLEIESGYTTNEPGMICVTEAIEKAVTGLIIEGILDNHWALANKDDLNSVTIKNYLAEKNNRISSSLLFNDPPDPEEDLYYP